MPLGQCRGKEVDIHAQDKVGTAKAGRWIWKNTMN